MIKKNILSVTIGIPAYNEEQNIVNLLSSLQNQRSNTFNLERVIVVSDGSTDRTEEKVELFAKKFPKNCLLAEHKRKGKSVRLEEMYKENTSDVLILFDADCLLGDTLVLEKIISVFRDPEVVFACVNKVLVKPENFIERLIYWWQEIIIEALGSYKNQQNTHNINSSGYAVRKKFCRNINQPKQIITDGRFLYFMALKNKKKAIFIPDAILYTRLPSNIKEYIWLLRRSNQQHHLADYFGSWVLSYYAIPALYKWKKLIFFILKSPFKSLTTILFHFILFFFTTKEEPETQHGFWKTLSSTKKTIMLTK